MDIRNNVIELKKEIEELKESHQIKTDVLICAASKYVDVKEIKDLVDSGINHIGENKVVDFLRKHEELQNENINWHFIGSLQTNKVKKMINKINYLHSLDREQLALEINKHREKKLDCFIEVNCSQEANKHGIDPKDVKAFVYSLEKYDKINIIGLMTMAENTTDTSVTHETFKLLKQIQEEIKALNLHYAPCTLLSMGMSNDYKIAILEGANIIRIGSKLFK